MAKSKRTYNLNEETVSRVRGLAGPYGAASSQDGVVELAVERLYREIRDEQDARLWASAAEDPEFQAEMKSLAAGHNDAESWPE